MSSHVANFIWLQGEDQLPVEFAHYLDDFTSLHPDWTVELWDDERIRDAHFPLMTYYNRAPRIVPTHAIHQFRADIARYGILERHAGAYFDVDYAWLRPITPHLTDTPDDTLVTCWETQYRSVANGFIYTPTSNHPALEEMIERIPDDIAKYGHRRLGASAVAGVKRWTELIMDRHQHVGDVDILDQNVMHPVGWRTPLEYGEATLERFPDSSAAHVWAHQRRLKAGVRA